MIEIEIAMSASVAENDFCYQSDDRAAAMGLAQTHPRLARSLLPEPQRGRRAAT
jgi:hypothetical protein